MEEGGGGEGGGGGGEGGERLEEGLVPIYADGRTHAHTKYLHLSQNNTSLSLNLCLTESGILDDVSKNVDSCGQRHEEREGERT